MSDLNITTLSIEIKTATDVAVKSVNSLASSVGSLDSSLTTLGSSNGIKAIKSLAASLNDLGGSGSNKNLKALKDVSSSLNSLAAVSRSSRNIGKSLDTITRAINKLSRVDAQRITNSSAAVSKLASALHQLKSAVGTTININNMVGDVVNGVSQIATAEERVSRGYVPFASLFSVKKLGLLVTRIRAFIYSVRSALLNAMGYIEKAMDYGETINLFETVFRKLGLDAGESFEFAFLERAQIFNKRIADSLGLDPRILMDFQAKFAALGNSMGIVSDASYVLSEGLTMLGADLASLYNIDIETAMEKLRSGIVGQVRPLRELGVDITNTALAQTALKYGIDDTVSSMDQQTKVILRILTVFDQTKVSMGDMARTISAPANQLRVLRSQFEILSRTIGQVFIPVVSAILPYVNAAIMALTKLISRLAIFFGYEVPNWDDSPIMTGSFVPASFDIPGYEEEDYGIIGGVPSTPSSGGKTTPKFDYPAFDSSPYERDTRPKPTVKPVDSELYAELARAKEELAGISLDSLNPFRQEEQAIKALERSLKDQEKAARDAAAAQDDLVSSVLGFDRLNILGGPDEADPLAAEKERLEAMREALAIRKEEYNEAEQLRRAIEQAEKAVQQAEKRIASAEKQAADAAARDAEALERWEMSQAEKAARKDYEAARAAARAAYDASSGIDEALSAHLPVHERYPQLIAGLNNAMAEYSEMFSGEVMKMDLKSAQLADGMFNKLEKIFDWFADLAQSPGIKLFISVAETIFNILKVIGGWLIDHGDQVAMLLTAVAGGFAAFKLASIPSAVLGGISGLLGSLGATGLASKLAGVAGVLAKFAGPVGILAGLGTGLYLLHKYYEGKRLQALFGDVRLLPEEIKAMVNKIGTAFGKLGPTTEKALGNLQVHLDRIKADYTSLLNRVMIGTGELSDIEIEALHVAIDNIIDEYKKYLTEETGTEFGFWTTIFEGDGGIDEQEQSILDSIDSFGVDLQEHVDSIYNNLKESLNRAMEAQGEDRRKYLADFLEDYRKLQELIDPEILARNQAYDSLITKFLAGNVKLSDREAAYGELATGLRTELDSQNITLQRGLTYISQGHYSPEERQLMESRVYAEKERAEAEVLGQVGEIYMASTQGLVTKAERLLAEFMQSSSTQYSEAYAEYRTRSGVRRGGPLDETSDEMQARIHRDATAYAMEVASPKIGPFGGRLEKDLESLVYQIGQEAHMLGDALKDVGIQIPEYLLEGMEIGSKSAAIDRIRGILTTWIDILAKHDGDFEAAGEEFNAYMRLGFETGFENSENTQRVIRRWLETIDYEVVNAQGNFTDLGRNLASAIRRTFADKLSGEDAREISDWLDQNEKELLQKAPSLVALFTAMGHDGVAAWAGALEKPDAGWNALDIVLAEQTAKVLLEGDAFAYAFRQYANDGMVGFELALSDSEAASNALWNWYSRNISDLDSMIPGFAEMSKELGIETSAGFEGYLRNNTETSKAIFEWLAKNEDHLKTEGSVLRTTMENLGIDSVEALAVYLLGNGNRKSIVALTDWVSQNQIALETQGSYLRKAGAMLGYETSEGLIDWVSTDVTARTAILNFLAANQNVINNKQSDFWKAANSLGVSTTTGLAEWMQTDTSASIAILDFLQTNKRIIEDENSSFSQTMKAMGVNSINELATLFREDPTVGVEVLKFINATKDVVNHESPAFARVFRDLGITSTDSLVSYISAFNGFSPAMQEFLNKLQNYGGGFATVGGGWGRQVMGSAGGSGFAGYISNYRGMNTAVQALKNTISGYSFKSIGDTWGSTLLKGFKSKISARIDLSSYTTYRSSDLGKIPNYVEISARSTGGFQDIGEIFTVREGGVNEFVGRYGNRSVVANNEQIINGVARGVHEGNRAVIAAIRESGPSSSPDVYVDGRRITDATRYASQRRALAFNS